ncbi:MAG: hypothetical protein MMC23_007108 [Stictis urceolatum]|nr:hypothetical protein [Stictis urceolata]
METEQSTDTQAAPSAGVALPKFSRYRSVRKAASTTRAPPPPIPQPSSEVKRSMSRYRRARPSNAPPTAPPLPTSSAFQGERPRARQNRHDRHKIGAEDAGGLTQSRTRRAYTMPKRSQTAPSGQEGTAGQSPMSAGRTKTERKDTSKSQPEAFEAPALFENDAQREAYAILNGETDRLKKLRHIQAERERERRKRLEEEIEARSKQTEEQDLIMKEEEERARQEAMEREEAKATEKEAARARRQAEKEKRQASLKSSHRQRTPPESHAHDYRDISSPERIQDSLEKTRSIQHALRLGDGPPKARKAEGKPPQLSLGFDAPISAVNAGTRKVLIKFNDAATELPVTLESTPDDLILSAADSLDENIEASRSILAESFKQVGLERPLRRYEHIRDVMNSWDHDEQNTFLILPAEMGEGAALDMKDAPTAQPEDISVFMHYSNKPGSWDKRWITLRSDGQVLVSKQPGVDQKNICHMTDFDIYIPNSKRVKKIKPPKKYCFAIKSQQKSSMFLSAANFVHFMSTKDKEQASAWYSAVQGWRSWYLVHDMGLGSKKTGTATATATATASTTVTSTTRQRSNYIESKPYQIGSFKPLLADDLFGNILDKPAPRPSGSAPLPKARGGPPVSFPKKLTKDPTTAPNLISTIPETSADPFSTTGLLGRTYSQRQRAVQDRINSSDPTHHDPLPSNLKPLVALTPEFKEPPQHIHKGRGFIPTEIPTCGLVNMATGRDEIYMSPTQMSSPAHTTQAPAAPVSTLPHRSGTVRSTRPKTSSTPALFKPGTEGVPDLPTMAFTGGGLLAAADEGIGAGRMGRGVASGDRRATEPMIELAEGMRYVKGSLLDSVERWEESEEGREREREKVVIDRGKRREGEVKVGEGL